MNVLHRSIFFSALERYGNLLFLLLSTAILSRLLTPKEFGIYALVNALTSVAAASFQEFGGANYLIQKPSLSDRDVRSAFTVILCLSALFAVIIFELRGLAAWFFSDEGLKIGIAASILNFFLLPFVGTETALFRRDMAFGIIARCNLAGGFVTATSSVTLAFLKFSFMAPILGAIAGNAVTAVLLIFYRRNLHIFRPSLAGYRDVIEFGAYSSSVVIINVFHDLSPQFIIGRILDFTAVGLYTRAINVTRLFDKFIFQVLGPVIMPAIFAQTRSGGDLKHIYLNAIELITVLQWPFLIFFAFMAEPIIWIWMGSTWMEIVPLVQMLCVASLSLFAALLTYPVLVAVGRLRDTLTSSLISLPPSLAGIFIASFFGIQAVAATTLLTFPFQAFVAIFFVSRRLAIRPGELMRATLKSGIVTASTSVGISATIMIDKFLSIGPVLNLLLAAIFALAGWWGGLLMTKHPLLEEIRLAASSLDLKLPLFGRKRQPF
jgi:O-antigen/teichoic acid export membrane protein